ncbi:MAG: GntR family transcriptional regulator [Propionibacteriales bacterium]|nr:GntR family transcriptional regulator [Propionibacteriales bacterium]
MPAKVKRTRANSQLLREQAYLSIRRMVMLGEFPTGQRLGEEQLADQLSVSRTPIREAFVRLHADRLLHRFADGGYYVAEIDLLDLRDLYELRLTLELRAVNRASEDGIEHDREVLLALREEWQEIQADPPPPDGSFIALDEVFHTELARASGNLALVETLESINVRIRQVRLYDFLTEDRIVTSTSEHLAIVAALLEGDVPLAAARLADHIGASLTVVEQRAADAMRQRAVRARRAGGNG